MPRKNYLYLFIGISLALACYLFFVDLDRKRSIEKYFLSPKIGDVYKITSDREDGGNWMKYYKLAEITNDHLVFYPSLMISDASTDIFLNHYDTTATEIFSRQQLKEIRNGKWNNPGRDNTSLIEIVRRN